MTTLEGFSTSELYEFKTILQSIINDYDSRIDVYQKLNNLITMEKRMGDNQFMEMCKKRRTYQEYNSTITSLLEERIMEIFNEK